MATYSLAGSNGCSLSFKNEPGIPENKQTTNKHLVQSEKLRSDCIQKVAAEFDTHGFHIRNIIFMKYHIKCNLMILWPRSTTFKISDHGPNRTYSRIVLLV